AHCPTPRTGQEFSMCRNWSKPTAWSDVCRRASGRRRFNAQRQRDARKRRDEVARLLAEWGTGRGGQARIARELKVSEATICRDLWALALGRWQERGREDPT